MRIGLAAGILAVAAGTARAESGRAEAARDGDDPRAIVELITDVAAVEPGGSFRVGVRFELDDGWHVYWKNPGEAAFATDVVLAGVELGELRWPAPDRFEARGSIVTYGYAHEVVLYADAQAPQRGVVELSAEVDFLVCHIDCIPFRVVLRRTLEVTQRDETLTETFDRFARRVPVRTDAARLVLGSVPEPSASSSASLLLDCDGCAAMEGATSFIAERIDGFRVVSERARATPHGVSIDLIVEALADPPRTEARLRGVARYRQSGETKFIEVDVPLRASGPAGSPSPAIAPPPNAARTPSALSLGYVLLLALLGGLVLNLMPCVLPILAVKLVALAQLGDERARAGKHASAYTLGVVATMLALATVVLVLRRAGTELGWGFQLQSPPFVTVLLVLIVAFALHLFGVFRLSLPAGSLIARVDRTAGTLRSFGEGVLAVVLATPCSAPFLGTAVGFALLADAGVVLAVFTCIGLGLAAPFALAAMFPPLRRALPRPGAWTHTLEQLLGFALLGTAVWLAYVLAELGGAGWIARALSLALAVGFAAWLYGTAPSRVRLVISLLLALTAALWTLRATPPETLAWEEWSAERLREARTAGEVIFVDFTADWCITCKANEALVLESERVRSALDDVRLLKADWTRRDDEIRAELARYGRGSVPLYLVFHPGHDEPQVLPELLTEDVVLRAVALR